MTFLMIGRIMKFIRINKITLSKKGTALCVLAKVNTDKTRVGIIFRCT